MVRIVPLVAAVLLLAGCANSDFEPYDERDLAIVSDNCRGSAEEQISRTGFVNDQSSLDRAALFDKAYRACMASHGYNIAQTPDSAGAQ